MRAPSPRSARAPSPGGSAAKSGRKGKPKGKPKGPEGESEAAGSGEDESSEEVAADGSLLLALLPQAEDPRLASEEHGDDELGPSEPVPDAEGFFNDFDDDFDEGDMEPPVRWCTRTRKLVDR